MLDFNIFFSVTVNLLRNLQIFWWKFGVSVAICYFFIEDALVALADL